MQFVVIVEADDVANERSLPTTGEQVLLGTWPARPANARLLILDPVTCRTLAETDLPRRHTYVEVGYMDDPFVSANDNEPPGDREDWRPMPVASSSDRCTGVAAPTPLPSDRAPMGEMVGDGAVGCANREPTVDRGDPTAIHALSVRVEVLLGTVAGCESYTSGGDLNIAPGEFYLSSGADGAELTIAWLDSAWAEGPT